MLKDSDPVPSPHPTVRFAVHCFDDLTTAQEEKWRYSNRAEVRFRINLFTVSQAAWSASPYGQEGKAPSGVGGGGYDGVETH